MHHRWELKVTTVTHAPPVHLCTTHGCLTFMRTTMKIHPCITSGEGGSGDGNDDNDDNDTYITSTHHGHGLMHRVALHQCTIRGGSGVDGNGQYSDGIYTQTHRDTQTHTQQTHRHTQTHTQRHRHTDTQTHRHTEHRRHSTDTHTETHTQTQQTHRHTDSSRDTHTRQTHRETDTHTDTHTDRQTDTHRHTQRQTDETQTHTDIHRERERHRHDTHRHTCYTITHSCMAANEITDCRQIVAYHHMICEEHTHRERDMHYRWH